MWAAEYDRDRDPDASIGHRPTDTSPSDVVGYPPYRTPRRARFDISDHHDRDDNAEPTEAADPIERMDAIEPTLPIDRTEPTLPIDRIEPFDPMESREFSDQTDQRELLRRGVDIAT